VAISERELLADIVATPDDDGPRLVYADWLLDRGDPRGELVNAQCALERAERADRPVDETEPLRKAARQLIDQHESTWLDPLFAITAGYYELRRGLVEHVDLMQATIDAARLHDLAPMLRSIGATIDGARSIAGAAGLLPIDAVQLAGFEPTAIRHVCNAMPRLRRLELTRVGMLHPDCVPAGLALEHFKLELHGPIVADGQPLLARIASEFPRLTSLSLHNMMLDDLAPLADLPLVALELPNGPLPRRADLKSLTIVNAPATIDIDALLDHLPSLRHLRLSNGRLGDRAALALAGSAHSVRLTRLDLTHNEIGTVGARALANNLHDLVELRLAFNNLDDAAKTYVRSAFPRARVTA
jgi:uncharacterized protein (TIGR02996 family)